MSSTNPLASPVYDPNYKCPPTHCSGGTVLIGPTGSGGGRNSHSIAGVGGSANISIYSSTSIVNGSSTGSVDGPILDPSAGMVYVFVNDDTGGAAMRAPDAPVSPEELLGRVTAVLRGARRLRPRLTRRGRAASWILSRSELCTRIVLRTKRMVNSK
jgi:hypothetical protein